MTPSLRLARPASSITSPARARSAPPASPPGSRRRRPMSGAAARGSSPPPGTPRWSSPAIMPRRCWPSARSKGSRRRSTIMARRSPAAAATMRGCCSRTSPGSIAMPRATPPRGRGPSGSTSWSRWSLGPRRTGWWRPSRGRARGRRPIRSSRRRVPRMSPAAPMASAPAPIARRGSAPGRSGTRGRSGPRRWSTGWPMVGRMTVGKAGRTRPGRPSSSRSRRRRRPGRPFCPGPCQLRQRPRPPRWGTRGRAGARTRGSARTGGPGRRKGMARRPVRRPVRQSGRWNRRTGVQKRVTRRVVTRVRSTCASLRWKGTAAVRVSTVPYSNRRS